MIDIMKQGLGQARPNKTAFAKQRTPQWGFQAAERSALADGGALPRQVPAEAPLGTVNEQRQGIIITVVPCLLLCIPYIARFGSIAAYVRTWPVRTYAGKRAGSCI